MTTTPTKPRWFHATPGKLIAGLLVVELCLLLADRLSLFGMERGSGWNVIWAVGIFLAVIVVGLVWFGVALVLKKRFPFGIISLFGLMCVVAVLGGWFSWKWRMAKSQAEAVQVVRDLGGYAVYDYQIVDGVSYHWNAQSQVPTWLRSRLGEDFFHSVRRVEIGFVMSPDRGSWEYDHLHTQASDRDVDALMKRADQKMRSCGGEEVRRLLERVVELEPKNIRANLNLAVWLRCSSYEEDALRHLDTVIRHADKDSFEWSHAQKLRSDEQWTIEEFYDLPVTESPNGQQ